ncbi:TlpA disulfide reductase family protein [Porticoccaceae bacterium LTM1]|nr:TlpA disulfide reductase family protein [Porticoccaceae bacterium LTM1]
MKQHYLVGGLVSGFFLLFSVIGLCQVAPAESLKNEIEYALEYSEELRKLRRDSKVTKYSDPEEYQQALKVFQEKQQSFNMIPTLLAAIELIKTAPESDTGYLAMRLFSMHSYLLSSQGQEGKSNFPEQDLKAISERIVTSALSDHIDKPGLVGVIDLPVHMAFLEQYAEQQNVWTRIMNKSPHRQVKAEAAFQRVKLAIDVIQAGSVKDSMRQLALNDLSVFSEQAIQQYGDVSLYRDTVKEVVEGKLFSLRALLPGSELPDVTAKTLDQKIDQLSRYRGKVVLIDFWSTWCGPCREAMPEIAVLKTELVEMPFEVISISIDDDVEEVLGFQQSEQPMPWVNWHIGPSGDILTQWDVNSYPTYFLVDANGIIRQRTTHLDDSMKKHIRSLVQKSVRSE